METVCPCFLAQATKGTHEGLNLANQKSHKLEVQEILECFNLNQVISMDRVCTILIYVSDVYFLVISHFEDGKMFRNRH